MTNTVHTIATVAEFRESFFSLIEEALSIVITAHMSPDDDSIASVLGMYCVLTTRFPNKKIQIIYTGQRVERYSVFSQFDKIQFVDDIGNHLEGVDTLILLDLNNFNRSSLLPETLSAIPVRICIDHHGSAPDNFTLALIDPSYSSNAELIYTTIEAENYLDKSLAEIFLLGVLGDTGNLTFVGSHQTEVFSLVKKLVEVGDIRIDSFLSRYRTIPKRIMPLLQEFVKNTTYTEVSGWPSLQYSFVSKDFSNANSFSDEEMSAASHIYMGQYLTRIEQQPWGLVFSPRSDGGMRMSSRSIAGSVNVRIFSESLGVGGGHDRASGGNFKSVDGTPIQVDYCVEAVLNFMKNNKPVLS